jgi:hypothetical protein
MSDSSSPQGWKKRCSRVPPPPTYIEGWGYGHTDGPPWQNPFPGGWGYPWWQVKRPFGRTYELVNPGWTPHPIPTFHKPSSVFWEPQGGQSFSSTSGAGSTISSSSRQVGLPWKKIRIEEVADSAPQPETESSNQASQPNQVGNACATGTGSTQVRRDESFAKLRRISFMKQPKTDFKSV